MSLNRYSVLLGNTFRLELETGHQLRAAFMSGTTTTNTDVTATDGEASFEPAAVGRYYLATREDSTSDWCRIGALDVEALVDETEERLVSELAGVNTLIEESRNDLVNFQQSDPSGTQVIRMTLRRLMETRGVLEARLADHRRRKRGRMPLALA